MNACIINVWGYTEILPSMEIYFYIYWPTDLYVLKTILKFSDKVYKSFVICKTVSKHAVIYAPSFGRL